MGQFEYLLMFASVILGMAVSDLAISLNRLLDAGSRVRWDWLAPMAALVALLKIVTQWWSWFAAKPLAQGITFEMFLMVLASGIMLFLMSAAALPERIGEASVDLRVYFARVSRRYWLLFAAQTALGMAVSIWAQVSIGGAHLSLASPALLVPPAGLVMAFVRGRLWHTLALGALMVLYVAQLFGRGLGQ